MLFIRFHVPIVHIDYIEETAKLKVLTNQEERTY